jgi:ABC-2 type transport system permease protein
MSAAPASLFWFVRHELTLAWRETVAMMTGGRRTRGVVLLVALGIVYALLHLLAYGLLAPWVAKGIAPDKATLVLLTGGGLLFWSVMLSQALESVTRVYYARSDLDLILSSPASSRKLFAVRTGAVALSTLLLSCLLASPLINLLIVLDGPQWLAAYGTLAALGALSAAIAVAITIALFRTVGPKRTRLIAQIVAAVVGAGFVIGIQAVAILYYGSFSRFSLFQSEAVIAAAPAMTSPVWLAARAGMGDPVALGVVGLLGFGALALTIGITASSYGRHAISASGLSHIRTRRQPAARPFRAASQRAVLRTKEWRLLQRDPWLLSQTLMQILYLLPPALLLWINFGNHAGAYIVVVPVLVMAAGQLAGGLAWLAISGEDAHDLVVTAPVSPRAVLTAKIEAVLIIIAVVLLPLLALLALSSLRMALVTAICAALSAGSATVIQLWFRVVAKRSMFRRRQVASRAATLSEAFASILWAGTSAIWAAGSWLAIGGAILALGVLGLARLLAPRR